MAKTPVTQSDAAAVAKAPPGPRGLPVAGSLLSIRGAPHRAIARIARRYGDVCLVKMGSVPTVVISHPEVMRQAFSMPELSDRWVSEIMRVVTDEGNDLALAPYGEHWRRLQRFANRELLSFRRIQQVRELYIEDAVHNLVERVGELSDGGEPVQPRMTLPRANAGMMFRAVFGRGNTDGVQFIDKLDELLRVIFWIFANASAANPVDYIPWLKIFPNHALKAAIRYTDMLSEILNYLIDSVEARPDLDLDNPTCLVEVMLASERRGEIERSMISGLIGDLLVAGVDTTAQTMAWLLLILANRPEIQARIQEEIDGAVDGDRPVGVDDKPNLPYLFAAILESMRYRTVAPFGLPHKASADCEAGGFAIRKGAQVLGNIYAVHHDARFWDEPDEFMPDRFMPARDGSVAGLGNAAYMPFGVGRRGCPGQGFAEIVIWLQASRLLQRYRFEPADGEMLSEDEVFGLSLMPQPYAVRATRR